MPALQLTPSIQMPAQVPVPTKPAPVTPARTSSKLTRPAQAVDPAQIAKSAKAFEAMAIGQLLKPMFDTVDTAHGVFGGGAGEEAWKPMMVDEFAKQIEARGGLGLAKPIYDAMIRMQGTNSK